MSSAHEWTEPGIFEVDEGVYRVPLPLPNDGLRAVNVYVIVDGDRLVCVDAGWDLPESREALFRALATIDCSAGDVSRYLVTHAHRDHYTQAVAMRREFATPVAIGAGEEPTLRVLTAPDRAPLASRIGQLRLYGADEIADELAGLVALQTEPLPVWELPDEWLLEGTVTLDGGRSLEVVETPGHTRGHVVFHDRDAELLFAGDHVLPAITPSIGFEPVLPENPLRDFLESLARVRAMPDAMLLPAHGPVARSVHARVDELVDHHGRRLEEALEAISAGADTAYEVALRLRWTRRMKRLDELDIFNRTLAVAESGAHLVLLETQGRLKSETTGDGVIHYSV